MGIYVNKGTLTFFDKIDDAIAAYNSENPPKTIIK